MAELTPAMTEILDAAENWVSKIQGHPNWWAGTEEFAIIEAVNHYRRHRDLPEFTWVNHSY